MLESVSDAPAYQAPSYPKSYHGVHQDTKQAEVAEELYGRIIAGSTSSREALTMARAEGEITQKVHDFLADIQTMMEEGNFRLAHQRYFKNDLEKMIGWKDNGCGFTLDYLLRG